LARQGPPVSADTERYHFLLGDTVMTEKFAPPEVTIRRYPASRICDVVVVVRGQEMVLRCPSYSQAVKWARLECKSYNIPEPATDFPDNEESGDVPLFLRPDRS
jgi:hypothetical protein